MIKLLLPLFIIKPCFSFLTNFNFVNIIFKLPINIVTESLMIMILSFEEKKEGSKLLLNVKIGLKNGHLI